MPSSKLRPLTPAGSKFLRYILSFVVTFGVGLAPIWSGKVPGFHGVLDVYPKDLQDSIPFVSLGMSVVAVAVQFFAGDFMSRRRLKITFSVVVVVFMVLMLATYVAYKVVVVRIQVPASHENVAYVVGATPLPTCDCAKRGLEIRRCIGFAISVNPDEVAACFSREEIAARSILLSVLYILLMLSLAVLIALLMLKESMPKERPKKTARPAARK